jgi:hypothetical protein
MLDILDHKRNAIKTTLRFHLIPVKTSIINNITTYVGKDMQKKEHLYTIGGNIN